MDRRKFLGVASMAAGHGAVGQLSKAISPATHADDLCKWVNLKIGTGGHGHTYPGATVPFGAVQLSPDTGTSGWDWCSGYYFTDTSIMGFSHTHLSGTGASDLLDVLLTPRVGAVKLDPGSKEDPESGYRSRYSHDTEVMEPGYYKVMLDTPNVLAEMTSTERVGFHRYTFPATDDAHILLDLFHSMNDPEKTVQDAEISVPNDHTIQGGRRVKNWAPHRQIYFAAVFSKPWTRCDLYLHNELQQGKTEVAGKDLKAVPHFDTKGSKTVMVKVGISMVSAENALANLNAELPGWDFEATRKAARAKWNHELNRVNVTGGSERDRHVFYTSMYHMMCAPTLADDVNGQYRGMDQKVHTLKPGEHNYSTYSLWDTFRALHPSFTLWQQERVAGMVNCLISMAEESPAGMPIWPLQGGETFCMTGYHSASVMAEACVKKVPGIDWNRAYTVMRKRNMDDDYEGLGYYRKFGYIPADKINESVSKLLEYTYNDFACSTVADHLGHADDAKVQRERAANYKHLFDPQTGFLRAKMADGSWAPNFDPRATGHMLEGTPHRYRDYTESNAWQSTFGVPHDPAGMIEMFGGREPFVKKLDAMFTAEPGVAREVVPDMSGFIGQYVHGNEPSHHIVFLYTYAGEPWKTQKLTRQVLDALYFDDRDGLSGNEDCGQMSAWYFMAALGLYAVSPASGTYVLTAPQFERAEVRLPGGKSLLIEAKRSAPADMYVQAVTLNGKPLHRVWVSHSEIVKGGHLQLVVGSQPNRTLGTAEDSVPPSMVVKA